jgi:hypothetical protein
MMTQHDGATCPLLENQASVFWPDFSFVPGIFAIGTNENICTGWSHCPVQMSSHRSMSRHPSPHQYKCLTFVPSGGSARYKCVGLTFIPGRATTRYKCGVICTRPNYAPVQKIPLFLYFLPPPSLPYLFFFLFFFFLTSLLS